MKKILLAVAGLAGLAVVPALAADMPVKARAPVAVYNWTGPYLGLSVGGRWSSFDNTVVSGAGVIGATRSSDTSTFRVGGYLGYNWQVSSSWLVGLEGDFAWGDGSKTTNGLPGIAVVAGDSTSVKDIWDGSIRGRAGLLLTPTILLYGTGGIAWQHVESGSTCSLATCVVISPSSTVSTTRTGWTLGGGVEAMYTPNWLVRAEYRYADFGTWANTSFGGTVAQTGNDTKIRTNTALLGVAYKF